MFRFIAILEHKYCVFLLPLGRSGITMRTLMFLEL